jgi:glycosyltransferase involved in cell wall biosynthesis
MGGIELVEKTITKAHAHFGDDVIIAAFAKNVASFKGEFKEHVYNIKEDLFLMSAPFNLKFVFNFRKLIKKHSIQRIYVHLPNPFMHEVIRLSNSFLRKRKIQVVAVYHSDIVNQKTLGDIYTSYFKFTGSIYDLWMCSSHKLWNSSKVLSSQHSSKQRIIPFCTDGVIAYRPREKFNGKLLAVGRLVPYKGFDFLVNTLNNTKYELNIIGNGPELKKLQDKAGKNIFLHRGISDEEKNRIFNESDVLIVSSTNRSEAYGMTIVEAFEAGMPVVASNIDSGVTFLTQHNKTGLVFDIKNNEQLLANLNRLETEPELYSKLSVGARRFFEEELTFESFKTKISQL